MPRLRLQRVEVEVEIPCESAAGDLPSASIAPGARSASGMACAEVDDLVTVAVDDLVEAWYRNVEPVEKAEPSAQRVEEEFKEETGGGQIAACVTGVFRGDGEDEAEVEDEDMGGGVVVVVVVVTVTLMR